MLLSLLYPKFCSVCGRFGRYICKKCSQKFDLLNKQICIYCEQPTQDGFTHSWCLRANGVDGYVGVFHYNTPLKKVIKNIKYRLVTDSWGELFTIIDGNLGQFSAFKSQVQEACLVPIPLHKDRLCKRGFNQAEVITQYFSKKLAYQTKDILIRTVATVPQAQSMAEIRRINVRGAFQLKAGVILPKEPVILVDDVVTTGATVAEAASTLKKSGAGKIYVFSVAKG